MNIRQGSLISAACSRLLLASLCTSLLGLGSCRTNPPGEITIDKAEVFTRERLVNRRLQEQQWLEKKLDFTNLETTFQGSSDLREFRGIIAALKGQFDPLGGAFQEATVNSQMKDRQRQEELAARKQETNLLRAEIDRLKAEQDLAKLKQNPGADVSGSAATTSPAATSSTVGTPPDASGLAGTWEALQKSNLPDSQDSRTTSAKLTPVEKLRDELAYRNAIHAALRETELDDAHDLNGYTLRTFKFDLSVTPHVQNAEHIGTIRLTTKPDVDILKEPQELRAVYRAWQRSMLEHTRLEALALQRRYLQGLITDDDVVCFTVTKERLKVFLDDREESLWKVLEAALRQVKNVKDKEKLDAFKRSLIAFSETREERIRSLERALAGLNTLPFNEPSSAPQELSEATAAALCKITEWRYRTLDRKYFYFNDIPAAIDGEGRTLYLPDLWPSPEKVDLAERDSPQEVEAALAYRAYLLGPRPGDETLDQSTEFGLRRRAMDEEENLWSRGAFELAELSYEIRKDTERMRDFANDMRDLNRRHRPYIYTVEPKELAQNISDVAAAEKLGSLALAVGAALPESGISAGGYWNQLNRSQLRLQAILRRPLVVGFVDQNGDGLSSFGWALGPRFEIGHAEGLLQKTGAALFGQSRSSVRFRQAQAQHSVQATMAIPGWLDKVEFTYQVEWHDPSATRPRKTIAQWKPEARSFSVNLPRAYEAITSALLTRHQSFDPMPTILPAKSSDLRLAPYILTEGEEKAALLIRGTNLWRNPQVFIGGQRAETVTVLPDMGGLYATFDKVRLPTTIDHGGARVDLVVVTSQGIARLPQGVQILPKAVVKPSGTVELKTAYAVPNGKLQFMAAYGLIPDTSHFGARLRARDATRMTWSDVIVTSVTRKMGEGGATEIEFELDPSQKLIAQPTRLTFDLAIQDEDGTPYRSIPSFAGIKGELVYFPKAEQARLRALKEPWIIKKEAEPSSSGKSGVTTCCACSDLAFQTDPNVSLDLFKRAHPWITEERTAFRIAFTFADDKPPILVPLGPGELQLSGDKPGTVCVAKNRLIGRKPGEEGSKETALFDLYERLAGAAGSPKDAKVAIRHPNGRDSIEVNGKLALTVESSTPAKTSGNRE